jgi:hypothetical protein
MARWAEKNTLLGQKQADEMANHPTKPFILSPRHQHLNGAIEVKQPHTGSLIKPLLNQFELLPRPTVVNHPLIEGRGER